MSLISRGIICKIMNSTNSLTTCHFRPGLLTLLNKKSYSTAEDKKDVTENQSTTSATRIPTFLHTPTNWDKRILVWTNKYPSIDQVPPQVSSDTLGKARNKARIYINLIMAGLTILASIAMIISGKRAAKRGESVAQMNLDWHESQK